MFGIIFFLALFISVISLFITLFTNNGLYFLDIIWILIIFFPLYGICNSLGWAGSSDGIITTTNVLIYMFKSFFYIFKFLYIHMEIISISLLLIFYSIAVTFQIISRNTKTIK